jgi:hypothetical protein
MISFTCAIFDIRGFTIIKDFEIYPMFLFLTQKLVLSFTGTKRNGCMKKHRKNGLKNGRSKCPASASAVSDML